MVWLLSPSELWNLHEIYRSFLVAIVELGSRLIFGILKPTKCGNPAVHWKRLETFSFLFRFRYIHHIRDSSVGDFPPPFHAFFSKYVLFPVGSRNLPSNSIRSPEAAFFEPYSLPPEKHRVKNRGQKLSPQLLRGFGGRRAAGMGTQLLSKTIQGYLKSLVAWIGRIWTLQKVYVKDIAPGKLKSKKGGLEQGTPLEYGDWWVSGLNLPGRKMRLFDSLAKVLWKTSGCL